MSSAPIDDAEPTLAATASEISLPRRLAVELAAGTHVGRYIVLDRLGAGGMGVVYAAFDPSLDRKVALKLLRSRPDGSQANAGRGRLLREARAMAQLRSPNVVTVYDVGEHEGHVYVAMEFIEGITLRRWLREAERSWREVLDAFVLAGRGLAAAHARGIIHRDFKPDNVMVVRGDAGTPMAERVRVMDFGLARPLRSTEAPSGPELSPSRPFGGSFDDAIELTRDGAIVGTPGYMAPEQHGAGPATAEADQFSFCVALWEALYGHRPFAGESPTELAAAASQGRLQLPPPGARVPAWVRVVVERGLMVKPSERWPNVDALLDALGRDPTQRQRKIWALVAALGLAAAGYGVIEARAASRAAACDATANELASVWNDDVGAVLRGAFAAAGDAEGATFDRTRGWIDAKAEAWRHARVEVCRASEIDSRFDAATTERARACLDENRGRLSSLLDALAGVDAASLRLAIVSAAELSSAEACTDVRSLALRAPPPADEATRTAAAEVRAELWRSGGVALTGDTERALAIVDAAEARVLELDNVPLLIELRFLQSQRLSVLGRFDDAESRLHEVLVVAFEARDVASAMRAASGLAFLVGYQQRRLAEGLRWGRVSLAMLQSLPDPPDADRIVVLRNLAVLDYADGEHEAAIDAFTEVLALQTAMLGEDHPALANALQNLAAAYLGINELDRAAETYERQVALIEAQFGPDDAMLASALQGLSSVREQTGRPQEALELVERALEIEIRVFGREHPSVAESLCRVGELQLHQQHPAEALPQLQQALAIEEQQRGAEHPRLLRSLAGIAEAELGLGRIDAAVATSARALAIADKSVEAPHPMAALRFVAARARWDAGTDRPAALALARRAHDDATRAGAPAQRTADEIAAWLAEH